MDNDLTFERLTFERSLVKLTENVRTVKNVRTLNVEAPAPPHDPKDPWHYRSSFTRSSSFLRSLLSRGGDFNEARRERLHDNR